jgi:selenocysteine lyase/cysteine desulfurase
MTSLERAGIVPAIREGRIRYSPHFYLTRDEIARTVEATARAVANR